MNLAFYLMPFVVAFFVATTVLVVLILGCQKVPCVEKRFSSRHHHCNGVTRFGGLAIIGAFLIALFLDQRLVLAMPMLAILAAAIMIALFGLMDDFWQLHWKTQLFFQIVLVTSVFFMGIRIQYLSNPFGEMILFSNPFMHVVGFLIALVWILFLMNAMNWLDGIDGASGGISLIAGVTIFVLSQRPEVNQPPIGIITAALVGALLAFLIFNFNPAKIMAGTSGSMFMGFILAVLAIFAGAKIATTLLVLTIPILDALWVIGERISDRKSIFLADRKHLHYRLLQMGWSQRAICLFYYSLTICIAVFALNTRAVGKIIAFSFFAAIFIIILILMRRKFHEYDISKNK